MCEQLAQGRYLTAERPGIEYSRPLESQANTITITPPGHTSGYVYETKFCSARKSFISLSDRVPVGWRHDECRGTVHRDASPCGSHLVAMSWRHGGRRLGPDVQAHGRLGAGGRRVEPDRRLPITEASGTVSHPRRLPPSAPTQHAADEVHPRLPEIDVDDAVQNEVDPTCRHRGGHNTVPQHSVVLCLGWVFPPPL